MFVNSLRGQLTLFWGILLSVCVALGAIMLNLSQSSAGAQVAEVRTEAERACATIATRYAKSLADSTQAQPQLDLLQVLLQLVLIEAPRIEGGVWATDGGFLAYAYPTYEGSGTKRDVPDAERAHIAEIAQIAARTQALQTDVVRASREALVVSACPLLSPSKGLVAWTMTRTSLGLLDAQRTLRIGLAALLAFALASGLWLGAILLRAYRHVRRLESRLAEDDAADIVTPMSPTGVAELDRLVLALNRSRSHSLEARVQLREAERERARDQRLSSLGRMTGSIAHEIRNPIATMRLKAENALAGPADRHPQALQVILGQIARLDGLVQSLLAVVQPVTLNLQRVDLAAWLNEQVAGVHPRADGRSLQVEVQAEPVTTSVDPVHLARALENLLDNALRHARSRVCCSLQRGTGRQWVIRVDDDGPGVDPALRDQLFEPFATGRSDGTGLGLALAREVALAHGGDLVYVALPEGARFEMELPWRES